MSYRKHGLFVHTCMFTANCQIPVSTPEEDAFQIATHTCHFWKCNKQSQCHCKLTKQSYHLLIMKTIFSKKVVDW